MLKSYFEVYTLGENLGNTKYYLMYKPWQIVSVRQKLSLRFKPEKMVSLRQKYFDVST